MQMRWSRRLSDTGPLCRWCGGGPLTTSRHVFSPPPPHVCVCATPCTLCKTVCCCAFVRWMDAICVEGCVWKGAAGVRSTMPCGTMACGCTHTCKQTRELHDSWLCPQPAARQVGGYRVPKGWQMMLMLSSTARAIPEWVDTASQFDPDRWLTEDGQGVRKDPKGYLLFGDGVCLCVEWLNVGVALRNACCTFLWLMLHTSPALSLSCDVYKNCDVCAIAPANLCTCSLRCAGVSWACTGLLGAESAAFEPGQEGFVCHGGPGGGLDACGRPGQRPGTRLSTLRLQNPCQRRVIWASDTANSQ